MRLCSFFFVLELSSESLEDEEDEEDDDLDLELDLDRLDLDRCERELCRDSGRLCFFFFDVFFSFFEDLFRLPWLLRLSFPSESSSDDEEEDDEDDRDELDMASCR